MERLRLKGPACNFDRHIAQLRRDMILLSNLLKARFRWTRQAFKVTGGAALVENYSWYGAGSPQALAWSYAIRELNHLDRYSAMEGFCSQTQIWWHYQFSEEEVLVLSTLQLHSMEWKFLVFATWSMWTTRQLS